MLPIFITLNLFFFYFAKKFFGKRAALFGLVLLCFNPELLAHGRLITPDLTLTFFIFLFLLFFYQFLKETNISCLIGAGITLGLSLASKYTALLLLPLSIIFFLSTLINNGVKKKEKLAKLISVYLIAFFIINLSYGFKGSFALPKFQQESFKKLSENRITKVFLQLFPKTYLEGAEYQLNQSIKQNQRNFFRGKLYSSGIWYFFFLTFLFKTPIPLLVIILLTMVLLILKKSKKLKPSFLDFYFIFSVVFFLLYFSFLNRLNIGFRYILMIYPLLIFFVSRLPNWRFFDKRINLIYQFFLIILLLWYVLEAFKIHPYYLAYANQIIGGPKNAYKYWADSTLDWQQDNRYFFEYLEKNKIEIPIDPKKPIIGKFAVSVLSMNLDNYDGYKWLRKLNKEPIDNYGYTWLIFDISAKDLERLK